MDEDSIFELLEELIDGRNVFLGRTIGQLPHIQRANVATRFMANEAIYLNIITRLLSQERNNSTVVRFTIPSNFSEPVTVRPTTEQIETALQTIPNSTSNCAICQDSISYDGVKIRHCGHDFHRSCISDWFQINVRCPVCRQDIRDPVGQTPSVSTRTSSRLSVQSEDNDTLE